jgi:hypothetical protein
MRLRRARAALTLSADEDVESKLTTTFRSRMTSSCVEDWMRRPKSSEALFGGYTVTEKSGADSMFLSKSQTTPP